MKSRLPPVLAHLAEVLSQEGPRLTPVSALMLALNDSPSLVCHVADLSVASGIEVQQLTAMIATVRRALREDSPRVPEQHVVSKVLLGEFCTSKTRGPRMLCAYTLDHGCINARTPAAVGKVEHFVKIDSKKTEDLWSLTETRLPAALNAARDPGIFDSPNHVATIKNAVALHVVRSLELWESHKRLWDQGLARLREWLLSQPEDALQRSFGSRHLGLLAPSGRRGRELMVDDLMEASRRLFGSGFLFRIDVEDYFTKACELLVRMGLEIICAEEGEFLIGDVPAFTVDRKRGALGFLEGVALATASTVFLPLGPRRLAALGPTNTWGSISESQVHVLNSLQIRKARRQVYMRRGSELAEAVRTQRPPGK